MRCGWRLRPELLPPIGSSLPLFLFCGLLFFPYAFGSLWAGNQVTGGYGGRGLPGVRGCGAVQGFGGMGC